MAATTSAASVAIGINFTEAAERGARRFSEASNSPEEGLVGSPEAPFEDHSTLADVSLPNRTNETNAYVGRMVGRGKNLKIVYLLGLRCMGNAGECQNS